ncbi:MAG: hypothetical protein SFX73_37760 [Kofleriaceae bacterium]|nr:hypothetical protein [Kofleriaceae bacterium]
MGHRDDHLVDAERAHLLAAEVERERERADAAEQAFAAIVRDRDQLQAELADVVMRTSKPPALPWPVELPRAREDDEAASTARTTLKILALVVIASVVAMIIANTGAR